MDGFYAIYRIYCSIYTIFYNCMEHVGYFINLETSELWIWRIFQVSQNIKSMDHIRVVTSLVIMSTFVNSMESLHFVLTPNKVNFKAEKRTRI